MLEAAQWQPLVLGPDEVPSWRSAQSSVALDNPVGLLLYGGQVAEKQASNELWLWPIDDEYFTQMCPGLDSPSRLLHGSFFLPSSGLLYIAGGQFFQNRSEWIFQININMCTWSYVSASGAPEPMSNFAHGLVTVGGEPVFAIYGGTYNNDTQYSTAFW